jgi:putative membrane protein
MGFREEETMLKTYRAACLIATALVAAPALAQTTPPPASSPPAATAMKVNAAEFVNKAANSDMFEVQSSQLALTRTQDSRLREFAQRMVKDHTQASDKLKAAAQNQTVPTTLDQEHAGMLQKLQQAQGDDFSRQYAQMQLDGHQKAVALFESYAQNGDHAQLKQFAQQTVPALREHLQQITQIRNDMAGPGRTGQSQPGQADQKFLTQEQPGQWRATKLTGLTIYNDKNERIGDINEVLVDRDGKAQAVVIGVGGFLGLGEHDVAVPFDALQWSMTSRTGTTGPATTTAPASPPTGNTVASAGNTGADRPAGASDATRSYPDHAVLPNATKDQLQNAPQFRYGNAR